MATAFKTQKNGAVSVLAAGMLSTDTTLTLTTGTGVKFPAGTYWVTIWAAATANPLNDANMEIVLVTSKATDVLTISRSQLGTNGSSTFTHALGDNVQLLVQDQNLLDIQTSVNNLETVTSAFHAAQTGTATSIATSASGRINCNTKSWDVGTNYDASTNFRFTAPVTGYYFFAGRFGNNTASSGRLIASFYKNGAEIMRGDDDPAVSSVLVSGYLSLVAGDFVELWCAFTGFTFVTDTSSTAINYFQGHLVK